MNERIRELAVEANLLGAGYNGFDRTTLAPAEKKFAELILQDIINTALHHARWFQEVEKDDNAVVALCDLVKDIREEYGVNDE